MKSIEFNAGEMIFHCYETYHDEGHYKTKGARFCVDDELYKIVKEETVDLSDYEEVRLITIGDSPCTCDFEEGIEYPDDHVFDAIKTIFIMPNGDKVEAIELDDSDFDYETADFGGDASYISKESFTKDGMTDIDEEEDYLDDDEDFGW